MEPALMDPTDTTEAPPLHPSQTALEHALGEHHMAVRRFFEAHAERVPAAVYASADVRDAGWKAAAVDTNAFPAGFNNLCPQNRTSAAKAMRAFMQTHFPDASTVLLLPEDHTRNPFYLQNIHDLSGILEAADVPHAIGSADPEVIYGVQGTETPEGHTLEYQLVTRDDDRVCVGGDPVDLVLSNNDFTTGLPKVLQDSPVPIVPLPELGWDHRSKAKHFRIYNHLATELAKSIGMDPWHLTVDTVEVRDLDFKKREGLDRLGAAVDDMLAEMRAKYKEHDVDAEPIVFVKDAAGTYGMGITVARSADDVLTLNSRARQKMDKGKYGHKVSSVIVQEGIPTAERVDEHPAEPVFYMIGGRPVGAFMRIHPEKGNAENLNQPGMRFQPICRHRGCHEPDRPEPIDFCVRNMEQVAAELATLALSYEATPDVLSAPTAADVPLPKMLAA